MLKYVFLIAGLCLGMAPAEDDRTIQNITVRKMNGERCEIQVPENSIVQDLQTALYDKYPDFREADVKLVHGNLVLGNYDTLPPGDLELTAVLQNMSPACSGMALAQELDQVVQFRSITGETRKVIFTKNDNYWHGFKRKIEKIFELLLDSYCIIATDNTSITSKSFPLPFNNTQTIYLTLVQKLPGVIHASLATENVLGTLYMIQHYTDRYKIIIKIGEAFIDQDARKFINGIDKQHSFELANCAGNFVIQNTPHPLHDEIFKPHEGDLVEAFKLLDQKWKEFAYMACLCRVEIVTNHNTSYTKYHSVNLSESILKGIRSQFMKGHNMNNTISDFKIHLQPIFDIFWRQIKESVSTEGIKDRITKAVDAHIDRIYA